MVDREPANVLTLRLRSEAGELARLQVELARLAAAHALPAQDEHALQLVLEEIVTNIVTHGRGATEIAVQVSVAEDGIAVEVTDDGMPFDPLQAAPAAVDAPLEQRDVGGLGIHLVRSLAADICYRRQDDRNRLSLLVRRTAEPH